MSSSGKKKEELKKKCCDDTACMDNVLAEKLKAEKAMVSGCCSDADCSSHKGGKLTNDESGALANLLNRLKITEKTKDKSNESEHLFWATQPVSQEGEVATKSEPIEVKTLADVSKVPYPLPEGFEWSDCDVSDDAVLDEVYQLLTEHYVEDDEHMFRFDYSREFLRWALQSPGFFGDWLVGVRGKAGKKRLFAFISGIPVRARAFDKSFSAAEINFLCVHRKLRSKRLAPVLIKEITRRVNLRSIWQAVYTAGVRLPSPVSSCRYFHRPLNPKKLIDVGFSQMSTRLTMASTIKLYQVKSNLPGEFTPMTEADIPAVTKIIEEKLGKFHFALHFSSEEIKHWLLTRKDVVMSFVKRDSNKVATDVISFYLLPSTVLRPHPQHKEVKAAYHFYSAATSMDFTALLNEAICLAKEAECDVYNILDLMDHNAALAPLKFGPGDGYLNYYLYNWRCPAIKSSDTGVILL